MHILSKVCVECDLIVIDCIDQVSYEKPVTVNKWDTSAVKNALDDAVKKVSAHRVKYTMLIFTAR